MSRKDSPPIEFLVSLEVSEKVPLSKRKALMQELAEKIQEVIQTEEVFTELVTGGTLDATRGTTFVVEIENPNHPGEQ